MTNVARTADKTPRQYQTDTEEPGKLRRFGHTPLQDCPAYGERRWDWRGGDGGPGPCIRFSALFFRSTASGWMMQPKRKKKRPPPAQDRTLVILMERRPAVPSIRCRQRVDTDQRELVF